MVSFWLSVSQLNLVQLKCPVGAHLTGQVEVGDMSVDLVKDLLVLFPGSSPSECLSSHFENGAGNPAHQVPRALLGCMQRQSVVEHTHVVDGIVRDCTDLVDDHGGFLERSSGSWIRTSGVCFLASKASPFGLSGIPLQLPFTFIYSISLTEFVDGDI